MTSDQLGAVAGALLSLAFSYVPGLSDTFAALDTRMKRLVMAGLLLVVAVAALALSCARVVNTVECSQSGAVQLVNVFISALVANQAAWLISPQKSKAA